MGLNKLVRAGIATAITLASWTNGMATDSSAVGTEKVKHVLLISIDGMHAVDFYNCANGIAGANGGQPYCPNLAALGQTGINYVATTSSKPSDSFPGLAALITGGTPKSTGLYYDVAYDRSLDGPAKTTGTGLAAATARRSACRTAPRRTTIRASTSTTPSSTAARRAPRRLRAASHRSIRASCRATQRRAALRFIRGTSFAPTRSLAWSIKREDTQHGSTNTRPTL